MKSCRSRPRFVRRCAGGSNAIRRTFMSELTPGTRPNERIKTAHFTYPDEQAGIQMAWRNKTERAAEQAAQIERHRKAKNLSDAHMDASQMAFYSVLTDNTQYQRMHLYSDGVKTWMRLPPGVQDLPAVFIVDKHHSGPDQLMPLNYT